MTSMAVDRAPTSSPPHWRSALARGRSAVLRVPLLWKLLGANLVLVLLVGVEHYVVPGVSTVVELAVLFVASFAATGVLGWLALRPVAVLEATAEKVSRGDYTARAALSPVADRDLLQLTQTMNRLLDRVESDRSRIQYLAGRGVRAREIEREAVARELRESFAQTLSGVALQLTALEHGNCDEATSAALRETHQMVQDLTGEMRSVAETLYPGTLAELGLANAIEALARRVGRRSGLPVQVAAALPPGVLSAQAASALYRVAEEALKNVELHGQAQGATVSLALDDAVELCIEDDGRGIEMRDLDPLQAGLGLFSAKAVLALCGGELQISSGPGLGTRVTARIPLAAHRRSFT
jgi:signal transduction histidine kinase